MRLPFKTLDDVEVAGKRVLVRADLNSSLNPDTHEILDDSRIRAVCPTLEELSESAVVLMAHQGRPESSDFVSLESHVRLLREMGFNASFVDDIFGESAKRAIQRVEVGQIVVLENVRFFPGELKREPPEVVAQEPIVQELYHFFDLFVNDAFGAAHRSQPSIVGFTVVLPSVAGRLLEKEIRILTEVTATTKHPWTLVLGGSKVQDKVKTLEKLLRSERVDHALLGGLVATLFLAANGQVPPRYVSAISGSDSVLDVACRLLSEFSDIIVLPQDGAIEQDGRRVDCSLDALQGRPVLDVGPKTLEAFEEIIGRSAVVFANGPLGCFEREAFAHGSIRVLEAIASCGGVTVVGGGHLGVLARRVGLESSITHISTGGGACISFLTGEQLPLVSALEAAARRMDD